MMTESPTQAHGPGVRRGGARAARRGRAPGDGAERRAPGRDPRRRRRAIRVGPGAEERVRLPVPRRGGWAPIPRRAARRAQWAHAHAARRVGSPYDDGEPDPGTRSRGAERWSAGRAPGKDPRRRRRTPRAGEGPTPAEQRSRGAEGAEQGAELEPSGGGVRNRRSPGAERRRRGPRPEGEDPMRRRRAPLPKRRSGAERISERRSRPGPPGRRRRAPAERKKAGHGPAREVHTSSRCWPCGGQCRGPSRVG